MPSPRCLIWALVLSAALWVILYWLVRLALLAVTGA